MGDRLKEKVAPVSGSSGSGWETARRRRCCSPAREHKVLAADINFDAAPRPSGSSRRTVASVRRSSETSRVPTTSQPWSMAVSQHLAGPGVKAREGSLKASIGLSAWNWLMVKV